MQVGVGNCYRNLYKTARNCCSIKVYKLVAQKKGDTYMKKAYLSFYTLMIFINLLPFIPTSIKGILGIAFIMISSVKFSYRDGFITATLLILFGGVNVYLDRSVDYQYEMLSTLLGSTLYYFIAYYIGKSAEALKEKNSRLKKEIEKRKNTEKELKEKLTLMQSLMDTIPSPVFFKNLDYRYIGCNRAYEDSMGIREEDLIGKTIYDLADIKLPDTNHQMDNELLEGKDNLIYETVVKFANGGLRDIIINKAIFRDERDNPIGIVGIMTDITDKKANEMLQQSVDQNKNLIDEILEQDKMKTEFFSNISHELRTPLNVILGSVQLIETYSQDNQYYKSQEKMIKNIAVMKQNCYRLLRLVNNLIDITRIDASAFEINLKNCDIVSVVEEITLSVSDYVENKGINLVFDTDIEEKIMACDDEKIERIMLNLLSNAVKFTPRDGNIFVSIYTDDGSLFIKVSDDGIGIPLNKQEEIFQRFCQITDLFSRHHEGSGIGLNLVRNLVEMHEGSIAVESEPGKGTIFTIELPISMMKEEFPQRKAFAKQDRVERIHVEFSDIYFAS